VGIGAAAVGAALLTEGEKGLPLWAELDVKSGGHVGGGLKTSGPGSPLMAMLTASFSPPPGGSPTSGLV
jgi:hypothetical protein